MPGAEADKDLYSTALLRRVYAILGAEDVLLCEVGSDSFKFALRVPPQTAHVLTNPDKGLARALLYAAKECQCTVDISKELYLKKPLRELRYRWRFVVEGQAGALEGTCKQLLDELQGFEQPPAPARVSRSLAVEGELPSPKARPITNTSMPIVGTRNLHRNDPDLHNGKGIKSVLRGGLDPRLMRGAR